MALITTGYKAGETKYTAPCSKWEHSMPQNPSQPLALHVRFREYFQINN